MPNDSLPELKAKTESNVAYLGVDMRVGHKIDIAMQQIRLFKDKNIRAWFCDIMCSLRQMPEALEMQEKIRGELEKLLPWEIYGDNIWVKINTDKQLRARDRMYELVNAGSKRVKGDQTVNFRDQKGNKLPIEY